MKVSANARSTNLNSDRQVTLTVTSLSNNDYSRTANLIMNVPFSRMNETMRLVNSMGGKITGVNVSGGTSGSAQPRRDKGKSSKE